MRNKLGILVIELTDADIENGDVLLEDAILNKRDSIVELLKNSNTSKMVYIKCPETYYGFQGFAIRSSNYFQIVQTYFNEDIGAGVSLFLGLSVTPDRLHIDFIDNI